MKHLIRIKRKDGIRQRYWVGKRLRNYCSIQRLSNSDARSYYHYRLPEKQPFDPERSSSPPPYLSFSDIPGDREIHKDKIKSVIHYPKSEPFGHRNITTYKTKGEQFVTIMEDTHNTTARPYPNMQGYLSDTEKEALSLHKFLETLRPIIHKKI